MDELLDKAPCGFLRIAGDGTIVLTNTTLRKLLGHEQHALEGRHVDLILTPGARIFYQTHIFPMLRMHGEVHEVYLSLRTAGGDDLPMLLNAVSREDEGSGVSDWILVVMRRRNQFEEELLQAKKAAEEASRTKERFLSMMSHDLRAPLSGISMAADVLSGGLAGPVTDQQRRELSRIREASQYVLRLVKDMLNYAQLQAGRTEVRTEAIALKDVLMHSAAMVQHLADEAGLLLDIEGEPSAVKVLADADRLQQVVLNLLTNAVKNTAPGGQVILAFEQAPESVLLHVRDTGCGIPAERLDHIFHPFTQLSNPLLSNNVNTSAGGVGLGLAISRELTRAMGGDILVTSQLGRGSTFTVRLPTAEPSDETALQPVA